MAFCTKRCAHAHCVNHENGINQLISKHRFRSEQCFGTLQRLFGLYRAQYFGVAKIHAQMVVAALSRDLAQGRTQEHFQQINPGNRRAQTKNTNPPAEIAADWKIRLFKS